MADNSKSKLTLGQLVFLALLTALNVVLSRILIIPIPATHGNINFCDTGIFLAAIALGPVAGLLVGGLSGFLLDLLSGYAQFMLFSLVIHGLEGLLVGLLVRKAARDRRKWFQYILALVVGVAVMVGGYHLTNWILYSTAAGVLGLLTDTIQGIAGAIVALILLPALQKVLLRYWRL
ncbi:ECF transporter S component [Lactobacillus sp. ESL0731]|uniref:ECF transporter S component n=1 Tax=unclassified Lactobacillus TaxID=2620435 RepID=UPI0023F7A8C1|nr:MULTISPECIES: ECF transporter S component [unclassified Lactobacillus]WEV51878.1 ECF transporter S component [Lactobacillus sp. ESL0700]WEV63009.1 ECF transporter S component [Lactobacillus sp. ESL0731]